MRSVLPVLLLSFLSVSVAGGCVTVVDGDGQSIRQDTGPTILDARPRRDARPARDDASTVADGGVSDASDTEADASPGRDDGGVDAGGAADTGPPSDDAAVVSFDYDDCPPDSAAVNVPIRVDDVANARVRRQPPLTGVMIPFARAANIRSLNGLVVRDAMGNRLPAQFESLSRYDEHPLGCAAPIRHAYAWVRAIPAPGGSAGIALTHA